MITLLLGADDFTKNEYLQQQATKEKARLEVLNVLESLPVNELVSQDLFAGKKLYAVRDGLKFLDQTNLDQLVKSKNQILFLEEKIDKRTKFGKELVKSPGVTVREFLLPHGKELNSWIVSRVKILGGVINLAAVEELAVRLGRDLAKETKFGGKIVSVEEVYNLWQADSEIKKLLAFADGKEVFAEDVRQLVSENGEVDTLSITNAIADNQKDKAMHLLHAFLKEQTGSDEKGAVIQLNALLSEQFRNVAMVQDFSSRNEPEQAILEQTGWKSGRLFVIKKIAAKFSSKKIFDLLSKLSALDEELKTSSIPPKVILDLIVAQLFI